MTKTFDQICNGILGEMVTPTAPNLVQKPGQPAQQTGQPPAQQQTGQPPAQQTQNTQNSQTPDLKKISAEFAKLTDASQIEKLLTGLINPNAAANNKPA